MINKFPKNDALWALISQFLCIITMLFAALILSSKLIAGSLALGGLACFLPNLYLYRSVFKHFGASNAKNILKGLYWGEIVKIFLTIAIFGLILVYIPRALPLYLFVGYLITQIIFWVPPILLAALKIKSR